MTTYDLHTHTTASDGELSPRALIERARDKGVTCLAITDHDTLDAYHDPDVCGAAGITVCRGIELSASWHGRSIHVVGLNVGLDCESLRDAVRAQQSRRVERAEIIAARLSKSGFKDAMAGVRTIAGSNNIGRPHFAKYLVAIGAVRDEKQAFRKWLGRGKSGDVQRCWPGIDIVTSWIRDAGGTAVLAHPAHYKMTNSKLGILTDEFVDSGGQAIEVVSGRQTAELTRKMSELAVAKKLLASTGSDFHRPAGDWSEIGRQSALPGHLKPVWDTW